MECTGDKRPESQRPESPRSYLLAVEDTDFLLRDEMRPMRFALEFGKPEMLLRDWGVRSTVVVFGSARIPSPRMPSAFSRRPTAMRP